MLRGSLWPRRGAAGLLGACAALCVAASAHAKPAAPGAPGARHTWAPADKHGFGTAHQRAGNAYFTLRQSSLSEIYYPDLSTPSFRGLQFAVTDGETFVDRETVDDDPRHIEPTAPGVEARVAPLAHSLGFRQVTETDRWRLIKTWITDPARATVLVRVRFKSLTGKPLKLFVLADPAPGDDGNDDRGTSRPESLIAFDDDAASAVMAEPRLQATSSGYRGSESDPWVDMQDDKQLSGYDATEPGNVVQAARTRLNGRPGKRSMTLAMGSAAAPARRRRPRCARLRAGSPVRGAATTRAGATISTRSSGRRTASRG